MRGREISQAGRRRLVIAHDQRLQFGPAAAFRGAHGRDRERDIRPILAGLLHDLGAADQFERGLALAGRLNRAARHRAAPSARRAPCSSPGTSRASRRWPQGRCAPPSCAAGLACSAASTRASSSVISRCLSLSARIASFADLISSATAPNAPANPTIGRASLSRQPRTASRPQSARRISCARFRRRSDRRARRARPSAPASASQARAPSAAAPRAANARRSRRSSRGAAVSPSTRSEAVSRPGGKSRAMSVVSPCGRSTLMRRVTVAPSG